MIFDELEIQQSKLLSPSGPIFSPPDKVWGVPPIEVGEFMKKILTFNEIEVLDALGYFGSNLREFAAAVDSEHPDLWLAFGDDAIYTLNLMNLFYEYLQVVRFAKSQKFYTILDWTNERCIKNTPFQTHLQPFCTLDKKAKLPC